MKKIKINILTYLFYLLIILSGYFKYLIYYFLIMFVHEIGHVFFIKLFKYKINKITIFPCGGIIDTNININIKSNHLFLISIGGILFQLILFIFIKEDIFIKLNTFIIIFNILPIYPLDGYKIWVSFFERMIPYKILIKFFFIITFMTLFIFFYITKNIFMFIFLYLININFILNFKYYMNKFLLERYLYPYKYKKDKYISDIDHLYKNKNNYINDKNEYEILQLLFSYY